MNPGAFLRGTVDALQPAMRIRLAPHGGGSTLNYSAAGATNSLFFTTNGDDESDFLAATAAPVPAIFSLCSSDDTACISSAGPANGGALRFDATEPTTINLFECTKPLTGCTEANATESTRLTDLRARAVGLDVNVNGPPLISSGNRVFFDTDNAELTGDIVKRLPNPVVRNVNLHLPSGFRAQDRLATWGPGSFSNPSGITRSGSITCPAGTVFSTDLVAITVNVRDIIC